MTTLLHTDDLCNSNNPVSKVKKQAPAKYRLKGFLLKRLDGNAIWAKVDFEAFCKLTGISDRQARRAKNDLEEECDELVFRTTTLKKGRGWQVLVALKANLKYDEEPLLYNEDGAKRHVRKNLLGEKYEPLTDTSVTKDLKVSRKLKHGETPVLYFQKSKKAKVVKQPKLENLKKLAHWLKRELKWKHWDNCKVKYKPQHAYNYALKALKMGVDRSDIVGCYAAALERRHMDATDEGLNEGNPKLKYEPSSTVSLAIEKIKTNLERKQKKWFERFTTEYLCAA